MTDTANIRRERIERLLYELEYEITRGVMEQDIEPSMHMSRLMPCGKDNVLMEVHVFKTEHGSQGPDLMPKLKVVRQ